MLLSFAGMMTIGLLLAGWYVGERILAAQNHSGAEPQTVANQPITAPALVKQAAAFTSSSPAPAEALVPDDSATDEQPNATTDGAEVVLPLAAEYYLQIAALGSAQDSEYLKQLQSKGFAAHQEAGSSDGPGFIWIGPYMDKAAQQRAKSRLASAGILAIETVR